MPVIPVVACTGDTAEKAQFAMLIILFFSAYRLSDDRAVLLSFNAHIFLHFQKVYLELTTNQSDIIIFHTFPLSFKYCSHSRGS